MSLNTVVFSKEQVVELFGKQLVSALNSETKTVTANEESGVRFIGKNKKNIVWLIEEEGLPFLNDADFQFLTKVIEACRLNLDDIALVNMNYAYNSFDAVIHELNPVLLIASGISKNKISFDAPLYTIEPTASCKLFFTNSVEAMRNDAVKKSKLWVGLKELLSIS